MHHVLICIDQNLKKHVDLYAARQDFTHTHTIINAHTPYHSLTGLMCFLEQAWMILLAVRTHIIILHIHISVNRANPSKCTWRATSTQFSNDNTCWSRISSSACCACPSSSFSTLLSCWSWLPPEKLLRTCTLLMSMLRYVGANSYLHA